MISSSNDFIELFSFIIVMLEQHTEERFLRHSEIDLNDSSQKTESWPFFVEEASYYLAAKKYTRLTLYTDRRMRNRNKTLPSLLHPHPAHKKSAAATPSLFCQNMDQDSDEDVVQKTNLRYLIEGCASGNLSTVKKYYKDVNFRTLLQGGLSSPLHLACRQGHKEICEYFISQMVYEVSGEIIWKIPDNKYVQKALELFCVKYKEHVRYTRIKIKYVLVDYGCFSLLKKVHGQYVWDATSDLAQCFLDIPPISVVLDCDCDTAIILAGDESMAMTLNEETLWEYYTSFEMTHTCTTQINRYRQMTHTCTTQINRYRQMTRTLQTCRTHIDGSKLNTEILLRCIKDLSAHSRFPFHDLLRYNGSLLCYLNIEALNMSKWSDYSNVKDEDGDLPLHIICRKLELGNKKNYDLLKIFSQCDVNVKNNNGETPFQIAYDRKEVETVKFLVVNTPCEMYHYGRTDSENIEIANRLIQEVFVDTYISLPSVVCVVPGDSLLHNVARIPNSEYAIERMVHEMDINTCRLNSRKEFPLHVACRTGHSACSLQALSNCCVSQKDVDWNTPFDILVENHPMRFDLMVCVMKLPTFLIDAVHSSLQLFAAQHFCDVESWHLQSLCSASNNVLHLALAFNKVSLVQIIKKDYPKLFQEYLYSSNSQNEIPLHVAGKIRNKEAISLVLIDRDPNVVSVKGNTALHVACLCSRGSENDLEAVKYLIEEVKCDPYRCNKDGNTALHLACCNGCTDIVSFLLNEVKVNPNTKNKKGCTPLMLTSLNNHQIIRLLIEKGAETTHLYATYNMFFKKYSSKNPPPTPLNIIVVGKPSSGKTTIIEALKREGSSEKVEAEEHTAGIIPSSYDSESFGMTAWYDLAGQSEYYASHEAVLHTIMSSSSPLILLLVDSRKPQELIQQDILYWLHFFKNQALVNTAKAEPHLIVVFSFADEVSPDSTKDSISCCEKSLTSFINKTRFKFVGFVALDCRDPTSAEIDELRAKIAEGAKELWERLPIDFLLHCFYAFLVRSFQHTPAVTIEQVKSLRYEWISSGMVPIDDSSDEDDRSDASLDLEELDYEDENEIENNSPATLIPSDNKNILHLCEKLHDNGHLIIVRNSLNIEKSWLIINKEILLSTINGSLFAPPNFRQHYKDISTSTGVVKSSTIAEMFPDYDISMLIGFLVHLEYCQKITDQSVMKLLSSSLAYQSSDEYLFFPGLVSISKPDDDGLVVKSLIAVAGSFRLLSVIHSLLLGLSKYCY